MIYRRGGKPGGGTEKIHFIECPGCGCPNRPSEQKCMYCQAELQGPAAAIKGHLYPYLNNIRDYLFLPRRLPVKGWLWQGLTVLLAAIFIGLGVTFAIRAAQHGGYFNWTVGILLLIYGGAALRNAWKLFFRK